jgi:hypothetical protein
MQLWTFFNGLNPKLSVSVEARSRSVQIKNYLLKGTVQRKLRGVKLYISRFVSLWAVVASLWFCQEYSRHFEIHEKHFSVI